MVSPRVAKLKMRFAIVTLMALCAGCSTQHHKSAQPADVVATRIAAEWEQCAASGKHPVVHRRQGEVHFVGVVPMGWYVIPSGRRHSRYPVWAEVVDTGSGSETTYHRAFQIFSGRLDRVVRDSQQ